MKSSRRQFISKITRGLTAVSILPISFSKALSISDDLGLSKPWIELSKAAYLHNASQISQMAGGRPVIAVLKNNAYGLGDVQVAQLLEQSEHIMGIAVVKDDRALAIRAAGYTKPILLMGDFDTENASSLLQNRITLSVFSQASFEKVKQTAGKTRKPINVALYLDTGLGRMGIPFQEAVELARAIANTTNWTITQTFSTLTTPRDFAQEQIKRFERVIKELDANKIPTGTKHLAPSYSILDVSASHQDAVRPGIMLHGSFPLMDRPESQRYPLQLSYRLKAPIIRLEKLRAGETIGFSRFYPIEKDEWIATLPIGWADGYDSGAENGAKVLLGDQLWPVVNVNASHTNVSLGGQTKFKVGDVATLIGPERSEITPEGFSKLVGGHNYLQINYKESITKHVYDTF